MPLDKSPPVLILAGGLGTRISSINAGRPKAMVNVNDQPFIAHQLQLLQRQGIDDVVLCVGHEAAPLCEFVGNGSRFGMSVRYSSDYSLAHTDGHSSDHSIEHQQLLGTGGAVLKASQLVTSPFVVLYGDAWLDVSLAPIVDDFYRLGKPALMTVYRNNNRWAPSNLLVKDGQLVNYNKETPTADMMHIDFGLTVFSAQAFTGFPPDQSFDLGEVVKHLIAHGQLACHEVHGRFYEVGTPEGLAELEEHLLSQQIQT